MMWRFNNSPIMIEGDIGFLVINSDCIGCKGLSNNQWNIWWHLVIVGNTLGWISDYVNKVKKVSTI
jgi:hypothetical protein